VRKTRYIKRICRNGWVPRELATVPFHGKRLADLVLDD
jgi:hypothetical protein